MIDDETQQPETLAPDEVLSPEGDGGAPGTEPGELIEQPAKVMRIGSMVKQLLEEVRAAPLDEAGRARLKEIYESSVIELASGLSEDLREELLRMVPPLGDEIPTTSELRVAQAQLVGWLEGLFHGIQAALMAQQMAARAQLDQMQGRGMPEVERSTMDRPGTYL